MRGTLGMSKHGQVESRRPSTVAISLLASCLLTGACGGTRNVGEEDPWSNSETPAPIPSQSVTAIVDSHDLLPLDAAVRHGKLDNGLTYYIRENARPVSRAEIRLVVNAGSILEDEDQLGLAHVVEHMAFNGTERFEKQELVDYLESTGVRFGADLNAYTSFDETVYQLQVQTDSIELFDTGIDILREWASRVTFDPDEIERERGVVMEEWRGGRGAAARIRDAQFPVLLKGSRYAERLPIGTQESLANFDHEAVTRYYNQWYRPGLTAVVIVGDVDPDYAERRIREAFRSWEPADDPRERAEFGIPDHDSTLVASVTDDEAQFSSVAVVYKHPDAPLKSEADYRRWAVERLVHRMLNDRFEELTQSEDPPFFGAGSGKGGFARSKEFYNVSAIAVGDQVLRALEATVAEVERASRHGFVGTEIARAKASLLRSFETSFNERDKAESRSFVGEYVSHFLEGTASPGIAFEYEFMQRVLPGITEDELNETIRGFVNTPSRVVLIDGPTGAAIPGDSDVLSVLDEVRNTDLEPYVDNVTDAPLVAVPPDPGRVVRDSTDAATGLTWWTLSNGARVILKPTDFKNDEILFAAHSPGGTSLVPDDLDVHADFASTLIGQGGVANFGPLELQKQLSGKIVQVQPTLTERSEGFFGRSSPQDFETLLQLAYLYVTQPRADTTAYLSLKQRYSSIIETLKSDPNRAFSDTLAVTLSQHHPRRQVLSREMLDVLELTESHQIFAERFGDVSDFTFYFVGALGDLDDVRPLVEQYLGGMPGAGREEEARDLGIRPPTGHVERVVRKGQEPRSRVQIALTGTAPWSHRNTRMIGLIEGVLDIRLRELLREDLGGTYGVNVNGSLSSEPEERFTFMFGFGCDPERVDGLTHTVLDELERFRREGAPEDDVQKVREKSRNAHETSLRENSYWLNSLMFYHRYGLDPQGIVDGASAFFESTTAEDIIDAAQVYLDTTNMVRVILVPESEAGDTSETSGGTSGSASGGALGAASVVAMGG